MNTIENKFAPIYPQNTKKILGMFALYIQKIEAENAAKSLEQNGFSLEDISLLAPLKSGKKNFVYNQSYSLIQGALIGATVGAIAFGLLGLFLGANGLATPTHNVNPIAFEFSPVSAFAAAMIGVVLGAAAGVLVGIGSPKSAAKRYGYYLKEGGIVLVVHLKKETDRLIANRILERTRGQDINILDESKIWSTIIPEEKKLIYN